MFMLTAIAAGTEIFIIFEKRDSFIIEVLGSNASKKEGIPTVKLLIRLIWIGANGYGTEKNKSKTVKIAEYIVLTRNKLDVV